MVKENLFIPPVNYCNVHRLDLSVGIPYEMARRIHRALSVEANREIPRTRVDVNIGDGLEITIYAEDTHALRAAVNSYLRWLDLAIKVEEVIENGR